MGEKITSRTNASTSRLDGIWWNKLVKCSKLLLYRLPQPWMAVYQGAQGALSWHRTESFSQQLRALEAALDPVNASGSFTLTHFILQLSETINTFWCPSCTCMDQILTMHASLLTHFLTVCTPDRYKAVQPAYILVEQFTTWLRLWNWAHCKTERLLNSCSYWSCLLIWAVYTVTSKKLWVVQNKHIQTQ